MYISHGLLSKGNWDTLAEAANWSRRNADVLRDTHWVGGDPGKLQVYGWAAWSPEESILTLRNPSDKAQSISIDVGEAFDLPPDGSRRFLARSPWQQDKTSTSIPLTAGDPHTFTLQPFEVVTLEAKPSHR